MVALGGGGAVSYERGTSAGPFRDGLPRLAVVEHPPWQGLRVLEKDFFFVNLLVRTHYHRDD